MPEASHPMLPRIRACEGAIARLPFALLLAWLLSIAALPAHADMAAPAARQMAAPAATQTDAPAATQPAADCQPGGPCSAPVEVRMVVVTMFEIGADEGDAPGEFQLWKERSGLDVRYPFPQGHHDLWYNPRTKVLGMVTGIGTLHSATNVMALGLDQRFDLTRAYWLVAGIAGIDPEDASIGSAVWSAHLVDADLAHEIDAREIPADWPTGYFARRSSGPYAQPRPVSEGEVYVTNIGLMKWAYELTKDMALPDVPGLAEARAQYVGYPNAQRPPFVLEGGHLAGMTYWHGAILNEWANRWVEYWTDGAADYVTSAMEETGSFQAIEYLDRIGRVDRDRFLVLRAGSNYTMPAKGLTAAENLLLERKGYTGMQGALESLHLVGTKVIDTLLADWESTRDRIPGTPGG